VKSTGLHPDRAAPLDEATLIDRARAGDRDAQEVLARQHLGAAYALALRVLGDSDLAQDAAQDALVNALGALGRFRGDSSFRTWLLRITVNAARTLGRRQTRRREVALVMVEDQPSEEPDPGHAAAVRAEAGRAIGMLQKLPPKQRAAVELRVNQGLSFAEVGEVLDCSEGAARVNYHLGIKRLREMMR
jgi:RNA polymerase sigma-70 factor (ECF subfamily)